MENVSSSSSAVPMTFSGFSDLNKYASDKPKETTGFSAKYSSEGSVVENNSVSSTSVFDVASYILFSLKSVSTMKLHKLLYYCQAWSLVWEEKPLFPEEIEAWANGPVIRKLFNCHRGLFSLSYSDFSLGNHTKLTCIERENIDSVLKFYGDKSPQWLIDQTHSETPWINAREGLAPMERGNKAISLEDMQQYYAAL